MKRLLLAGCLWPALSGAQEVKPVYAADYQALIRNDSNSLRINDSSNSMRTARLKVPGNIYYINYRIRKISIGKDSTLMLKPAIDNTLYISGSWSTTAETQRVNRMPSLQKEYAQGHSVNGQLSWQGPETNELLSYGPAMRLLEFDGSNYLYDQNGRLVNAGTGNGQPATVYNNSLLRPASFFTNNLGINFKYPNIYGKYVAAGFKAGQTKEKTFIRENNNKYRYYTATLDASLPNFSMSSSYNNRDEWYDHSNRNGFLNRLYQQSLFTPVSFSNAQGSRLNNGQRSYSPFADNPLFLLENPSSGFRREQHSTAVSAEYRMKNLKFKLGQSLENKRQTSHESLQPGTAGFPTGRELNRFQFDKNYSLQSTISYSFRWGNNNDYAAVNLNHIYADNRSSIRYGIAHPDYQYQRTSQDLALSFSPSRQGDHSESGINLGYKYFTSNTSRSHYWLPMASGFHRFNNLFNESQLSLKLYASYDRFNSEIPVSKSLAAVSLLQLDPEEANQYNPVLEVNTYSGLRPVQHREFQAGMEIRLGYRFSLSGNWFNRNIRNDIFPFIQNNEILLRNIAGHYNRGIELQFDYNPWLNNSNQLKAGFALSFMRYQSKVTGLQPGFDQLPLTGFRSVHTALVKGEPVGVIMGHGWLRNANNQVLIGQDGFPLMDQQLKVLGNPIPDFVLKWSDKLRYKNWDLVMDFEWKKGGDTWNGTQAMLDYYGRSAVSAEQRGTRNYIFEGVMANGSHNTIPVSFYDPTLPFSQNRWVRYGTTGVTEEYIQKADLLRISTLSLSWKKILKKYLQQIQISAYANNILLWSPYKGADSNQLLFDQSGTQGLDFFNLPAVRAAGISLALQF